MNENNILNVNGKPEDSTNRPNPNSFFNPNQRSQLDKILSLDACYIDGSESKCQKLP